MTPGSPRPAAAAGWRRGLTRAGDALSGLCAIAAAVALAVIIVINAANVFGRYLFSSPIPWAEECMGFLMIFTVFAGAAATTWRNRHIRIATLVDRLPLAGRRAAFVLVSLIGIAALSYVAIYSEKAISMFYAFNQRSETMEIPIWIPQSAVLGGLVLMALFLAMRLVLDFGAPDEGSGVEGPEGPAP